MAVEKIEYAQKAPFQTNENVPETNQCTADDMNEIKETVNNNADELTTAQQNIENLQTGQGTASGDITSLKNRVTTLETDNTTNKQDISSLKSRTTTLETDNETNKQNIANKVDKVEGKGLSTEDYTTGEKQKLAGLNNYDDTAIKKEIQELDDNQIHITTEKSDNLNVKDASGQNAKINAFGISKQETRSGKNKFNIDNLINVTEQNVQTGSFVASSLYGTTIINNINLVNLLKPNTNYKCIANVTLLEKPATITSNIANMLTLYKSIAPANNIPVLKCSNTTEKNNWQVNETKQLETTFTTDNDLSLYNMLCYCYANDTEAGGKFKFENIMILEATEQDETFEQYGASPSPEYPSEIQNTTRNVNITDCNKNFVGGTWTNGLYNTEGILSNQNGIYRSIKVFLKKGTYKYASTVDLHIARNINLSEKTLLTILNQSFTLEKDAEISIGFRKVDSSAWNLGENLADIEFQLEKGSVATSYVEHEQQTITFPLQENQKMLEGSYLADDGIHHKRKQIELDGSETVYDSGSNETTHHFTIPFEDKKIGQHGALSNMFINSTVATLVYSLVENPSIARITFKMPLEYTTVDSFKTFLSQQKQAGTPVIVEYELETEEIEAYTEEQQTAYNQLQNAKTYKTVTNVFTENAELEMEYIADTKTYIDNEINSIKEQINTINELLSTTNTSALLLDNLQTDLESEVL